MEKVKKIKKANLVPIKKQYLLEDDLVITQDNELKARNKVFSVFDFRFFENNTQKAPIIILINSENINKKIINMLGETQALIISSDSAVMNNKDLSKITNFFFDSEEKNNLINQIKEHLITTNNCISSETNSAHKISPSRLPKRSSLKEVLFSGVAEFFKEEKIFLQELSLIFINAMLTLEDNFPDYKYKKSKIIFYLDEISHNVFELLGFMKKVKETILYVDLIIMNSRNIIFKLDSCMNQIYFPDNLITKKGIGLLPTKMSIISTKGLKWDVENWQTEFGKNLSTSNELLENECRVYVDGDGEIYFTAELL